MSTHSPTSLPTPSPLATSPALQTALAALSEPLPPIRPRLGYRLALLLSTITLLLVLLLYLALIAGTIVLMLLERRWLAASPALLLVVLIPESILVLFLLKPLFRRPQIRDCPLRLARTEEPALYAFVDRLCAVTGASPPQAIDVVCDPNAAAGFDGLFRGFLRNELILTIGLPLAAGLTIQQLGGVIAHEIAHFAQYGGTRLSVITRKLNGWLARCVYERDRWDYILERLILKTPWIVAVWCYLLWRLIWLARAALWALLRAGHFFCAAMLREMEFEADRYANQIMGASTFAETARQIALLSAGADLAYRDLNRAWMDRRLGEDLPDLMLTRSADLTPQDQLEIAKSSLDRPVHWFDTHPTDRQRLARLTAAPADGILHCSLPASALFSDFPALCRRSSLALYRIRFGSEVDPAQLISSEELRRARERDLASLRALARYAQHLVNAFYPLALPPQIAPASAPQLTAEQLLITRRVFETTLSAARPAARRLEQADLREVQFAAADSLFAAGFTRVNLPSGAVDTAIGGTRAELINARRQAQNDREAARAALAPAQRMLIDRWSHALALAPHPIAPLLDALHATAAVAPHLLALRAHQNALGILGAELRRGAKAPRLRREILARAAACRAGMSELQQNLARIPNPFSAAARPVSLAEFVVESVPDENAWKAVAATYQAAGAVVQRCVYLHFRLLGALAVIAEDVESLLNLNPLPAPSNAPPELPLSPSK